jgi:hypothetical protein
MRIHFYKEKPEDLKVNTEEYQLVSVANLGEALERLTRLEQWAEANFKDDETLVWDIDIEQLNLYLWFSKPTSATLYALSGKAP